MGPTARATGRSAAPPTPPPIPPPTLTCLPAGPFSPPGGTVQATLVDGGGAPLAGRVVQWSSTLISNLGSSARNGSGVASIFYGVPGGLGAGGGGTITAR